MEQAFSYDLMEKHTSLKYFNMSYGKNKLNKYFNFAETHITFTSLLHIDIF